MRALTVMFVLAGAAVVRGFAAPRRAPRARLATGMVLSPDTREALKSAGSPKPTRAWAVCASNVGGDLLASLDQALAGAKAQLGGDGTVAVVRIVRDGPGDAHAEKDADVDRVVHRVRRALGGVKHVAGLMVERRGDDDDLVSVSLGQVPEADVRVFHLDAESAMQNALNNELYRANDQHFILYPQEDFAVGAFLNRVRATNPEAQHLGEPVWNGDVTFLHDAASDEPVRKYRSGMVAIKVPAVVELQKEWPWWQQSLEAMLSWCDR